jgi:Fic family protein
MSKTGTYVNHGSYKTFQPRYLNESVKITDERTYMLLADAMRYLGELNAYSQLVPDIDYFIRMHIAKEATTSSMIEGTNTNLEEALLQEHEIIALDNSEKRDDWEEVQNYIAAINSAIVKLQTLPLATRLICETHEILLSGVRGFTRAPGQIRKVQNWIGGGDDIKTAAFVPPAHETVKDLMSDLEKYWHNDDDLTPVLIKTAMAHYQFETIHPFLDGNGRTGRLMITLQLIDSGILTKPTLYISDYFERNRAAYYDSLERVRHSGDYDQWVRFFIGGVAETARDASQTMRDVVALKERYLERIQNNIGPRRQHNARELLTLLFAQPIVNVTQIKNMLGCSIQTANELANIFFDIGIFRELTGYRKNRQFVLGEYFDLFDKPKRSK